MIRSLDGTIFSRVLRAGALAVVREQEEPNRINVFPVRHADTGANLAATLKAAAARLGSSAHEDVGAAARMAAGGGRRLRVHLHTNEPQLFLSTVAEYGAVTQSKVDDTVLQQLAGREATSAVVVDSTTDLPETESFELGVVAVPLTLSIGEAEYLDGVDIRLEAFSDRLLSTTGVPRSSQPAAADLRRPTSGCSSTVRGRLDPHRRASRLALTPAAAPAAAALARFSLRQEVLSLPFGDMSIVKGVTWPLGSGDAESTEPREAQCPSR